jgi:hypothetical protein
VINRYIYFILLALRNPVSTGNKNLLKRPAEKSSIGLQLLGIISKIEG